MCFRRLALSDLMVVASLHSATARVVGDLYDAETIVTGTEEPERTRGFRAALETVIVKLTGATMLPADPRVAALAARPHGLVQTFEYEDRMKGIPVHDEQGTRERPHFLRVTFSKPAIDAALHRLGVRQWPADRPVVAIWLGVDTPASRFVLSDAGPEGYGQRAVITETARRLGLPVELPRAQQDAVGFDDVASDRVATLSAASPKADTHLVGKLSARGDGYWDVVWNFHAPQTVRRWHLDGVTFDRALKHALARVAEILSGAAR